MGTLPLGLNPGGVILIVYNTWSRKGTLSFDNIAGTYEITWPDYRTVIKIDGDNQWPSGEDTIVSFAGEEIGTIPLTDFTSIPNYERRWFSHVIEIPQN